MNSLFLPDLTPHLEEIKQKAQAEEKRKELIALMQPAPPFPDKEMTEEARQKRLNRSKEDFWFWDKTYFPESVYPDYAKAGRFHQDLVNITDLKDKKAHVFIGPRGTAKTATLKKKFIYDFLHGKRRNMAVGSEVLTPATSFIKDMSYFLQNNPRILADYKIDWIENSAECLFARSEANPKGTFVDALSMDRSSRGRARGIFLRYDLIFLTDWENLTSSLTKEAVEDRVAILNEMRTSLSDDGTLIAEGNNFDVDCAQNRLLEEYDKGILSESFQMHHYAAWSDARPFKQRSIWSAKYPATSEQEMKSLMKPKDEYDWSSNYQGRPKKKSGNHFPDTFYQEWTELPQDLKSVIYTDPNTSLKGKGDTTAITSLGWSAKLQAYFIPMARCRSYFDSNELLMDFLIMRRDLSERNVIASGMDGNVTQESVWTNNILQFTRIHHFPFPYILFKKYRVDDLITSPEGEWKKAKFYFPPGFAKSEEGKAYLKQLFSFTAKKAKKKDDAPDSLICAYQLLIELGISMITSSNVEFHRVSNRQIKPI
jgi:hypothetical protein